MREAPFNYFRQSDQPNFATQFMMTREFLLFLSGSSSSNGGVSNPKCGDGFSVPQGQGASFFCRPSLFGRYVTIRRTSSVVDEFTLCEVEVYSTRRGKSV